MRSQFVRNSFFGAIAGSTNTMTSFLSGIIVARELGVAGSGIVAYVIWLISVVVVFSDIGFTLSVSRYGPALVAAGKPGEFGALSTKLFWLLLASLAFYGCVLGFFAHDPDVSSTVWSPIFDKTVRSRPSDPLLWGLVIAGSVASALSAYFFAYLRGRQKFASWALISVGSSVLQIAAILVGGWFFGVTGSVVGYLLGTLPSAAASLVLFKRTPPLSPELRRDVFRYAAYAWVSSIVAAFVWARIEVFILGRYWGSEAVGLFSAALAMANMASQGALQLTTGLLPRFSEQMGRNDLTQMHLDFARATRLIAFLVFPSCLGLAAILPRLMPLLYGEKFDDAIPASIILVLSAAVTAPGTVGSNLLYARGRTDIVFIWNLAGAVLSLTAAFLLIPILGPVGAASSRAFTQICLCVSGWWFIAERLHCGVPFGSLGRLLIASCLCAAAAAAVCFVISGPISIVLAVPLAAIIYFVAVWLIGALPPEDLEILFGTLQNSPVWSRILRVDRASFFRQPKTGSF